jgi:hypothetical protein
LHPPDIFKTAGRRRSSVTGESLMRSFSKFLAVNNMSQEGIISKPLLEIFKTVGRRRSLLAGVLLVWSSLASSKVRAVVARTQEGKRLKSSSTSA